MRMRKTDSNGDYVFGHGAQDFLVNSPACVAQAVLAALNLLQGTWVLDSTAGVPWLTEVVGRNSKEVYDQVVQNAILAVEGVVSPIVSYQSSLNTTTRVLTINKVTISTLYGEITLTDITLTGYGAAYGGTYGG